jgi:hypothetical protein
MTLFRGRFYWWAIGLMPVVLVSIALVALAWGQQSAAITQIEEDWELVIGAPSANSDAPQVTCVISPAENVNGLYATFMVNHHDTPTFTAGGLQIQAWNGETLLATKRSPDQAVLNTPGETIRWTQVMRVTPDGLVFEVVNGPSTTWGAFGAEGSLAVTVPNAPANLNGYSAAVSAEHSGVSFAGNRVQSLVLKRVRAYAGSELLGTDANPRVVHSLSE